VCIPLNLFEMYSCSWCVDYVSAVMFVKERHRRPSTSGIRETRANSTWCVAVSTVDMSTYRTCRQWKCSC